MEHLGDRLFTVDEAYRAVLERVVALPARRLPLRDAVGCVLAEPVTADLDLPPFDKSLVDGFAICTEDLVGAGCRLTIGEEIAAGETPTRPLAPGEAAAVMTGAPLPANTDAVVMIEHVRFENDGIIVDPARIKAGQNRLPRGRELRAGDIVLRGGERLTATRLGLLASVGRTEVVVRPPPRVVIVPTGNELVEPGQVPGPGQIRNSNAVTLEALARGLGAVTEILPIARDEAGPLADALARGLEADILLVTGGVSVGNRDLVPSTLSRLGVERVFHKIRLRPGKPLWFGVGPHRGDDAPGTLVFGLPGNPVSGIVGFLLMVRPAVRQLFDRAPAAETDIGRYPLAHPFTHPRAVFTCHPGLLVAGPSGTVVEVLDWAGSSDLRTVARADGFALFSEGENPYKAGEVVGFLRLG
jgi:molybdopterin molybdotransferase